MIALTAVFDHGVVPRPTVGWAGDLRVVHFARVPRAPEDQRLVGVVSATRVEQEDWTSGCTPAASACSGLRTEAFVPASRQCECEVVPLASSVPFVWQERRARAEVTGWSGVKRSAEEWRLDWSIG